MRTKLIKVVSLLLTISFLMIASSLIVTAAGATLTPLGLTNSGTVTLDGTNAGTVTVSIVCNESVSYALQGKLEVPAGFTLTEIKFNEAITSDTQDVAVSDVNKGEIAWVDWDFSGNATGEGFVILTATYTVAAGTTAGNYHITFTSSVYTGADGEIDKDPIEVTTTVKVEVNEPVTPPATGLKGDVNGDGLITSADLTALARHIGGIEYITDETLLANADVNGDTTITSADLTKHARYVGGIITDWSQD